MIRGYARVSTDGQSFDAQVKQLRAAGAERIFRETASGARSDRAQLRRALAAGDVLMMRRLDRPARSTMSATTPGRGLVADPGLVGIAPGKGAIMIMPVSVCHQVSTIGQRPLPIT